MIEQSVKLEVIKSWSWYINLYEDQHRTVREKKCMRRTDQEPSPECVCSSSLTGRRRTCLSSIQTAYDSFIYLVCLLSLICTRSVLKNSVPLSNSSLLPRTARCGIPEGGGSENLVFSYRGPNFETFTESVPRCSISIL